MRGALRMITANIFIDWDSARRIHRPKWSVMERNISLNDRAIHVEECFSLLQKKVSDFLGGMDCQDSIRIIKSRIYHGWHSGKTMSADRRAWDIAKNKLRSHVERKVSFLADIEYSEFLSAGGQRMPLYDTLRTRDDGTEQQKMVDTAMVADILSFCRTESRNFRRGERPNAMAIIVGDDDDLLPGAMVAEAWGLPTYVLRITREDENKFLNTNRLTYKI